MKTLTFLSFLMIWSSTLFAGTVTNVRLNPDIDLVVTGTTNTTFTLGSIEASGDSTAEGSPSRVYVPMDGPHTSNPTADYDEVEYFTEPGVTSLFTAGSASTINFPLYLNATASDYYLYVAVKDMTNTGNSYKIARQYSTTPFNGTTNYNMSFPVPLSAICTQTTSCGNFASQTLSSPVVAMAYFFFSTSNGLGIGNTVTPATDGIYYEINMSNRIYPYSSVQPSVSSIRAGDKRLTIAYSSNANILQPKALRIFNVTNTAGYPGENLPFQSYNSNGTLLSEEYKYNYTGEVIVTDLENEKSYNLAIVFVDLYKFGTVVSNYQEGKAMTIEELLKKNQCFLLTAGFGEDHYVINYFRNFRDQVLSHSIIGRAFIHTYYELAPKYALMIYEHEGIRAAIRGAAYVLYFIFNYILILSAFLMAGVSLYLYKRKYAKVS